MRPKARPRLYLFSGLPGAGKSTLAQGLAARVGAVYLRIDTLEQALRELCGCEVQGEGYRLAYRLAGDNLRLGADVVADCCNPIALTRGEWLEVARGAGADGVNILVRCSDLAEHRRRVETRLPDPPGLRLPTWQEVLSREFQPWTGAPLTLDTAGRPADACLQELLERLGVAP